MHLFLIVTLAVTCGYLLARRLEHWYARRQDLARLREVESRLTKLPPVKRGPPPVLSKPITAAELAARPDPLAVTPEEAAQQHEKDMANLRRRRQLEEELQLTEDGCVTPAHGHEEEFFVALRQKTTRATHEQQEEESSSDDPSLLH